MNGRLARTAPRMIVRALVTVLVTAVTTLYTYCVFHDYPGQVYPIIVGMVAAVSWRLGMVTGAATLILTIGGIDWYVLAGPGLAITRPEQAAGVFILLAVGAALCWSTAWLRSDRDKRISSLAAALSEAEAGQAQLAEIMHRVHNDLSGLASIARLKRRDPDAALDSIGLRTTILSRLYRRLAVSGEDGAYMDMNPFLSGVVEDLQLSHGEDRMVSISADVQHMRLPVKIAGVLALTVNEAIQNSVKYAAPNGGPCEIIVSLKRTDNECCALEICDDGVGPDGGPAKGTGMGTRLMRAMASQIAGRYAMTRENERTIVRLSFPS